MKSKQLTSIRIPGWPEGIKLRDRRHASPMSCEQLDDVRVVDNSLHSLFNGKWVDTYGVLNILGLIFYRDILGNDYIIVPSILGIFELVITGEGPDGTGSYSDPAFLTSAENPWAFDESKSCYWDHSDRWLFLTAGASRPYKWDGTSPIFATVEGLDSIEGGTDDNPVTLDTCKLVKWYEGALHLLNTKENGVWHGSRIRCSNLYPDPDNPDSDKRQVFLWKRDYAAEAAGYIDLDDTPGEIKAAEPLGKNLIIYKTDSIYRYYYQGLILANGTAVPYTRELIEQSGFSDGAVGRHAVLPLQSEHIFVGRHGVWRFDGYNFENIGLEIAEDFYAGFDWERADHVYIVYRPDTDEIWISRPGTASDYFWVRNNKGAWSRITGVPTTSALGWAMHAGYVPIDLLHTVFTGACSPTIDNLSSAAPGCPNYATVDDVGRVGGPHPRLIAAIYWEVPLETHRTYYPDPATAGGTSANLAHVPSFRMNLLEPSPGIIARLQAHRLLYEKHESDAVPEWEMTGYDRNLNILTAGGAASSFALSPDAVGELFSIKITLKNVYGVTKAHRYEADFTQEGEF